MKFLMILLAAGVAGQKMFGGRFSKFGGNSFGSPQMARPQMGQFNQMGQLNQMGGKFGGSFGGLQLGQRPQMSQMSSQNNAQRQPAVQGPQMTMANTNQQLGQGSNQRGGKFGSNMASKFGQMGGGMKAGGKFGRMMSKFGGKFGGMSKFGGKFGGSSMGSNFGQISNGKMGAQQQGGTFFSEVPAPVAPPAAAPTSGYFPSFPDYYQYATAASGEGEPAYSPKYTIRSKKYSGYCLDASAKKLTMTMCIPSTPSQAFTVTDGYVTYRDYSNQDWCISPTFTLSPCTEQSMVIGTRADGASTLILGNTGKCARTPNQTKVAATKANRCNTKAAKQGFIFTEL